MLPACEYLDKAGYFSLECWGGATFDSCLRFLNEDPWERLRQFRKALPNTKLQMLLRGQNILGYKHYADDTVEYFVKKSIDNGIDIIRIFDALNDLRNMEVAVKAAKAHGGIAEIAMSYTISPVHTEEYFVNLAKQIEDMGADLVCIKDMANLLLPYPAYSLVKKLKKSVKVPIVLHTHNTTGTGAMTLLKAVDAGVDVIDTALSPLGDGTAQPVTEAMVATLAGTEYDTGIDLAILGQAAETLRPAVERLNNEGWRDPGLVLAVDVNTLRYQVPGGMLSNLIGQLKQAGKMDKFEEVLAEVPRVREDFGYPPLVTPTSQIVGTQAVMNVIIGERYKMVPNESKALLRGEYGRLPAPVNKKVQKQILGDEPVITGRPADDIAPQLEGFRKEIAEFIQQDEDVLSYASFPQVAKKFFEVRQAKQLKADPTSYNEENGTMVV